MAHTVNTLTELYFRLTPRDIEILTLLKDTRCMFTHQLTRTLFTDSVTPSAASKACRRNMKKLSDFGLVGSLDRRIGGFRAGSSAQIWYVSEQGHRLLNIHNPDAEQKRERFIEPSTLSLRHRLAVVECYVQLKELSEKENIKLVDVQFEPSNWESYRQNNKSMKLKPDLFIKLHKDGYEYLFYIEVDLASESMPTILSQCERYHDYFNSGLGQEQYGVFPAVLWIVPDKKRKQMFIETLSAQYQNTVHLFSVITAEELTTFISSGLETTPRV